MTIGNCSSGANSSAEWMQRYPIRLVNWLMSK